MKFTSFTIKNFKSIGEEGVTIHFSPITLLFGANNSGKSTIIQALHLAHEVICNGNFSPNLVSRGGKSINLGGFINFVHGHDVTRTVRLRLDFERTGKDNESFIPYYELGGIVDEQDEVLYSYLISSINKTSLEIGISWSSFEQKPFVSLYKIYHNDSLFVDFSAENNQKEFTLEKYNEFSERKEFLDESLKENYESFLQNLEEGLQVPIRLDFSCPSWNVKIWTREDLKPYEGDYREGFLSFLNSALSSLILGPGWLAETQLCRLFYIGASRVTIPRLFDSGDVRENDWADGKAAWKNLAEKKAVLEKVNVEFPRIFGEEFAMTIHQQRIRPEESNTPTVGLPTLLLFRNEQLGIFASPGDLGHGISQIIPLIAAPLALESPPFLAIEEPEANIHPAWQVELAEFFLRVVKQLPEETADDGPPLIILETHSEHMMLRLLRRIRETYEDALPEGATDATPDDVAVYYVQKDGVGCTEALRMEITPDGDFVRNWPKGFFEERVNEVF